MDTQEHSHSRTPNSPASSKRSSRKQEPPERRRREGLQVSGSLQAHGLELRASTDSLGSPGPREALKYSPHMDPTVSLKPSRLRAIAPDHHRGKTEQLQELHRTASDICIYIYIHTRICIFIRGYICMYVCVCVSQGEEHATGEAGDMVILISLYGSFFGVVRPCLLFLSFSLQFMRLQESALEEMRALHSMAETIRGLRFDSRSCVASLSFEYAFVFYT